MKIAKTVFIIGTLITFMVMADSLQFVYCELIDIGIKLENVRSDIPSTYDMQRMLNEYEPENPIEVDGKIGIETIAKWDRVFCNQSALRSFEK